MHLLKTSSIFASAAIKFYRKDLVLLNLNFLDSSNFAPIEFIFHFLNSSDFNKLILDFLLRLCWCSCHFLPCLSALEFDISSNCFSHCICHFSFFHFIGFL